MMEPMLGKGVAIVLSPRDNVAVALKDLKSGDTVNVFINGTELVIKLLNDVPFGHKFAIRDIRKCDFVIKYGHVIGRAKVDIRVGEHVHVHNIESLTAVHSVCRGWWLGRQYSVTLGPTVGLVSGNS
ncbi:MAG: UxaA family hydrolase [Vulcanisaeta sp.]|nr:UxaA family hydrolase [Vulcanisaeta sp.]